MSEPIDIDTHPSTAKGLWVFAAAMALSMHLAFAGFAYVQMMDDANADDLGAPGIEIGLELASPDAPPSDLPPGPDSEASVASIAQPDVQKPVESVDLPQETAVEAENPDRLVTLEKPKENIEKPPEVPVKQTNPSEASVASEAMAMPSVEAAVEAPKATTVDQGSGQSRQRVRVTWQKELVAHLDKHKKYPAERSQQAAQIILAVTLDRMGRVVEASVNKSSGDEAFDRAALAMVQRASPVPAPPPLVADEGLNFTLPVNFRVGGGKKK